MNEKENIEYIESLKSEIRKLEEEIERVRLASIQAHRDAATTAAANVVLIQTIGRLKMKLDNHNE